MKEEDISNFDLRTMHAGLDDVVLPRRSFEILRLDPRVEMPKRAYDESAGYDLSAFLVSQQDGRALTRTIAPHTTQNIPTGLCLRPPSEHLIAICSRSGMAARSVFVANAPGVVDPNYTGEIRVLLYNGGDEPCYVKSGDRIAQAVVLPFTVLPLREVDAFPSTQRGKKGFGSSGQ